MTNGRQRRLGMVLRSAVALGMLASPAWAQLSHPTLLNNSNPNELFAGSVSNPSFERESGTAIVSSAAGAFVTRYFSLVTTDGDGGAASGLTEPLTSDYTISFTSTAPGAYRLTVDTHLTGDMNLVDDSANGATADVGSVSGTQMGGTIESGSLSLSDPGIASSSGGGSITINKSGSAVVFGVSNGLATAHSLRFVFLQTASTDSSDGDEAAIRLGGTSDVATETAGDYPGSPSRTQANDGHFVTVTLASLCGNGVLDTGPSYAEDCDEGVDNGQPGACCNPDCTFVTTGTGCDDGNTCTTGETCTSGLCGGGTPQTCPLCQTCDPMGGCMNGPRDTCKITTEPFRAKLQIKDSTLNDNADVVQYKWVKGEETQTATFGNPNTTDAYALCVFAPNLVLKLDAPAGGVCGTRACWKVLGIKGFSYKDRERTPNGVDKISLKGGLAGKAKTQLKGKGPLLPTLPLPLPLPAKVQLQSAFDQQCWEATFSSAGMTINDVAQFKGKGD